MLPAHRRRRPAGEQRFLTSCRPYSRMIGPERPLLSNPSGLFAQVRGSLGGSGGAGKCVWGFKHKRIQRQTTGRRTHSINRPLPFPRNCLVPGCRATVADCCSVPEHQLLIQSPFGFPDPNGNPLPARCMRAPLYPLQPALAQGRWDFPRRSRGVITALPRRSELRSRTRSDRRRRTRRRPITTATPRAQRRLSRQVQGEWLWAGVPALAVKLAVADEWIGRLYPHELQMTVAACRTLR